MNASRRAVLQGAAGSIIGAIGLSACSSGTGSSSATSSAAGATSTGAASLALDPKAWKYDESGDVYYQIGVSYVATPQAKDYETLGVYVPGKYFSGTKNSDGTTYTVKVDAGGSVGGFTAETAPVVLPVNTPGYAAQKPPTSYSYSDVSEYMKAGFVYVAAGLRGKDSNGDGYTGNAPWGVTDLKSAVRYLRYNAGLLPGHHDRVFVFGHSGGGAQSAVMGASGDSDLYTPYLQTLGAAMTDAKGAKISDAIAGAMCWCPITSLDEANAAYEWNMGQFATTGTRADGTWTKAYSTHLAEAFATYQNGLGLTDEKGAALSLTASPSGTYLAGSYYDHLLSVVEASLNEFLQVTTFPYTPSTTTMAGMGGPGGGSGAPSGAPPAGATGAPTGGATSSASTTYASVEEYIAHLNSTGPWVTYDATTKKAKVASLEGFVKSQKNATKDVGAFDGYRRQATENVVFGQSTTGLHFSKPSRDVVAAHESEYAKLSDWSSDYAASGYDSDFAKTDGVGKDVAYRANMYNPMYYLAKTEKGYGASTVAPHWRIRTGIMQGDTASTVEVNLALALQNLGGKSVDFATVWGQGHTMAESTGSATTNFISWVKSSVA